MPAVSRALWSGRFCAVAFSVCLKSSSFSAAGVFGSHILQHLHRSPSRRFRPRKLACVMHRPASPARGPADPTELLWKLKCYGPGKPSDRIWSACAPSVAKTHAATWSNGLPQLCLLDPAGDDRCKAICTVAAGGYSSSHIASASRGREATSLTCQR